MFQTAEPEEELDEDAELEANAEKEIEKKALALPESKIKAYWAAKEKERKAPRVHQKELSMREKMLREFDMSSRYGVSTVYCTEVQIWTNTWSAEHGHCTSCSLEACVSP